LAVSNSLVSKMSGEFALDGTPSMGNSSRSVVRAGTVGGADSPEGGLAHESAELCLKTQFGGMTVLLAEDEPVSQEVSRGLLEDVGLVVDLAADGEEAVRLARENRYALILMDMQMPNLSGDGATRAIRANSSNLDTPIVAMSASVGAEVHRICLDAGMNDYIAKPVDPEALFSILLFWLQQSLAAPAPRAVDV